MAGPSWMSWQTVFGGAGQLLIYSWSGSQWTQIYSGQTAAGDLGGYAEFFAAKNGGAYTLAYLLQPMATSWQWAMFGPGSGDLMPIGMGSVPAG
ncbi:MAG TPA: hypothetical protein VJY33_03455 [Isosphaeraceae bacterium]|nr:hypothetical protein [Isosphaeraceae bacterium]